LGRTGGEHHRWLNTATGDGALFSNTEGTDNTAHGASALLRNTTGGDNTASGTFALQNNTTGGSNTASGAQALLSNTTGNDDTAIGLNALLDNTTGSNNTAVGSYALSNNTIGSFNIALGRFAGDNVTTANNAICIGVAGANVDNSCYIGNIFGATSSGGIAVLINSNGKLGTTTSSRRFKDDIKSMDHASEAILALKPVTFRYKKEIDPAGTPQFGLVAEEVEKVNPDLVVRDKEGKPYSVRYDQVNAMLLNEFLKEHRAFVEEQRKIVQQQKEIDALKAELKEQRSLIEKASAQVEMRQPATKVAAHSP
jgi:hypothetical protein